MKEKDLNLIGKNKIENKDRAPTISFYSNKKTSKEISNNLINLKSLLEMIIFMRGDVMILKTYLKH